MEWIASQAGPGRTQFRLSGLTEVAATVALIGQWALLGHPAHKVVNPNLYQVDEMLSLYEAITAPTLCVLAEHNEMTTWWKGRYDLSEFRERIAQLPMSAQWWKRIFLGNAMDVEMDGTGRVLISPELRQAAGISKDTMLLGMGNHFELWDKATYEAKEAEAMSGDMPDVFRDFSF